MVPCILVGPSFINLHLKSLVKFPGSPFKWLLRSRTGSAIECLWIWLAETILDTPHSGKRTHRLKSDGDWENFGIVQPAFKHSTSCALNSKATLQKDFFESFALSPSPTRGAGAGR